MRLIERPSPNWNERPGDIVDSLVLHYTGMASGEAALARLCDPQAEVSAHYVIDEAGTVHALVAEHRRAWHAGRSAWAGRTGLNDVSIGIELVNPGHEWGYRPFAEPQMLALLELCRALLSRWPIPASQVLAHADVSPNRKEDPGELFDWARLAAAGIGRGLPPHAPAAVDPPLARRHLAAIGYALEQPGVTFIQVVTAFQRRYRQRLVNGALDPETMGAILALSPLQHA